MKRIHKKHNNEYMRHLLHERIPKNRLLSKRVVYEHINEDRKTLRYVSNPI